MGGLACEIINGVHQIIAGLPKENKAYQKSDTYRTLIPGPIALRSRTETHVLTFYTNGYDQLCDRGAFSSSGTDIADIESLSALVKLTTLNLSRTDIDDIRPLSALVNLTSLHLSGTKITDIGPLSALVNLTHLCIPITG